MLRTARRLFVSLGFAVAALAVTVAPAQAQMPSFRSLIAASDSKYAAIVVDAKSGEVLYSNHGDSPRYPASLTKMMTLYLTFEALSSGKLRLNDRVPFSPHAAAQSPTKLGVAAGDSITVEDAIQAMAIKSANDAATAMAERIGGTEARFTALMTLRARELGMEDTRFVNANGLPDTRQISTARDMAILSRALMRDYPQYYHYFSQPGFTFRGRYIKGHNHLLGDDGVDGLKTGYTRTSGFNIAISGVRDNRRLVVVVMGGPSAASRDQHAEDLLLTGFDVMARRAHGEQVTVAQNLSEPLPNGPVVRAPTEQGDGEQDNLRIVLADAQAPRSTKLRVVESRPDPRTERAQAKRKPTSHGEYSVQVGAFRAKADARRQLTFVQDRFGKQLGDAKGVTGRSAGRYTSLFNGLTEKEARATCRAMRAKKLDCLVRKN